MKKVLCGGIVVLSFLGLGDQVRASTIVGANVTTTLGPNFFFDTAATGGNDYQPQAATAIFDRSFGTLNVGSGGTNVSISGIGWASAASNVGPTGDSATAASVTITYLGADGVSGGTDDVVIGTVTDNFTYAGTGSEYAWKFDAPLTKQIDGLNNHFEIAITPIGGSLEYKTTSGSSPSAVKLSVAGTSTAVPEPASLAVFALGGTALLMRRRSHR